MTTREDEPVSVVLLVEDDGRIGALLTDQLRTQGLEVRWVRTLEQGRRCLDEPFDLALVDLSLPDGDGLDLVREVRSRHLDAVVVVLTAHGDEVDVLVGLDAGADDYLVKPVRIAELLGRLRAHLRRSAGPASHDAAGSAQVRLGSVVLDLAARRVTLDGVEVALRTREYDLLVRLAADAGRAVSREDLIADVWDENWFGSTKTLDVHVAALRRRLGGAAPAAGVPTITALRGFGYRLDA